MSKLVKSNLTTLELKLLQDNSEIYCYHCGSNNYIKKGYYRGVRRYLCKTCKKRFSDTGKYNKYRSHLPLGDDVWHAEDFGLRINKHKNEAKLVFLYIQQDWLKEATKKFIRYSATTKELTTLQNYIRSLNTFSNFIANKYPQVDWNTLTREIIIDYIEYLNSNKLSSSAKRTKISSLRQLLEIGRINGWFHVSSYLIRTEDYPKLKKRIPRYIPEEVMTQLNQYLDLLPEPVMRMVLVIQETGLRVSELLQMPVDCLKQDTKGDWFIQYTNWKMTKEDTKPISTELAEAIQEQQQYIKDNLPEFKYLFCARKATPKFIPKPKVMSGKSFIKFLKALANKCNICDNHGEIWKFQTHQFRHTVGTRMINNGVPQHIIQRYLGHESPEMTSVYAYIHDQTLKKEIAKYHDNRVVNVAGEVVKSSTPELDNDLDLHLLKKKVLAQSLPNGSCARPVVLGECPHANACLTCGDFRTTIEFLDQHKAQLEETEKLVQNAEEKGWKRHAEMNTKVRNNLNKIITTLESGNKDIVSGGDE
ncbi:MAG: tyrosine-type recombinase/integrase [Xenococcus sp. (in: cyanobacteria)]